VHNLTGAYILYRSCFQPPTRQTVFLHYAYLMNGKDAVVWDKWTFY